MNIEDRLNAINEDKEALEEENKIKEKESLCVNVICDGCNQKHSTIKKYRDLYVDTIVYLCDHCEKSYSNKKLNNEEYICLWCNKIIKDENIIGFMTNNGIKRYICKKCREKQRRIGWMRSNQTK